MKNSHWLGLLALCAMFIFVACRSQSQQAQIGGTVFIGVTGDFDSFNELNAADGEALQVIQYMLFMSLTTLDENLQFAPQLAESWEFSPGDTVLTYHLRQDVLWTDGAPTTAEDVLFTYQLATNPDVAYPAANRFDQTGKAEILDDYTIRFHFKQPYPDALLDTQMPILPRHILEKIPPEEIAACEFNRRPVGNGPFQLVEWLANERLTFAANLRHALGRPPLDRVVFQIIPDEAVLLTNLMTGAIDIAAGLSPLSFKQIAPPTQLQARRYPGRNFAFIAWNLNRPMFTRGVRQALTHAINKQEIIDTLLDGLAQPAAGPLLPFVWAYDSTIQDLAFDPEMAKRLLQEEGWKDSDGDGILNRQGKKFEFTLCTNADNQLRKDVAVMVQAQLKKIGVAVKVELMEWNLLLEQVFTRKDFDAVMSAWDADFTVNPAALWHSGAIANGYNFVSYRNARADALLEKGRTIVDRRKAAPLWHEFQKIIVEDCPYTFLFVPERLAAVNQRVQGVKMDVRSHLANIHEWWMPPQKRE
jgi:peptide/nickel transport system substrate-binding protein